MEPETKAYEHWKSIPLPIYQRFYFFNVSNAIEIERSGAKPNLVEIGPFTYRSKWEKTNIIYYDNGTVSYNEKKTYYFVPELSFADENVNITTLNAPLAATLTLIQNASPAVRLVITLALDGASEGFFITRTPKQLIFNGYSDLLTTFGPLLNPRMRTNNQGKFGWLFGKNGTEEGPFNVYTGASDINMLNLIDRFKGSENLPYWTTDECNSLKGSTNAQMFPPLKDEDKSIYFFHPDFCRKWKLNYNDTFTTKYGVKAKRFVPDPNLFKNQIDYPPNGCFISKLPTSLPPPLFGIASRTSRQRKIRFPSGVFDMSTCKYGAPVFMSFPHFLGADPYYASNFNGIKPNSSLHSFYMSVAPTTGSSVETRARVQINIFINKPPGVFRFRNVPDIVFPVFWQELAVSMSEEFSNYLNWAIKQPSLVSSISSTSIFIVGIIFILTSAIFPLYNTLKLEIQKDAIEKAGNNMQTNNSKVKSLFQLTSRSWIK